MFVSIPNNDFHLKPNQIDIWQFSLEKFPKDATEILIPDELMRAERFYFERHRRRFIIARATLRLLLGNYLQRAPLDLCIEYTKHGKPFLDHSGAIQFNLSHSGELALLAVGQSQSLGIDIEFFSARPYEGIAAHLFSEEECLALNKLPKAAKTVGFFHIWSQKEAFIKAVGLGLAYPTKEFSVPISMPSNSFIYDPLLQKNWQIKSFMPQIACSAALCYDPKTVKTLRFGKFE